MAPNASPWGWKVTIHVYGSGRRPTSGAMVAASEEAAKLLKADDFVGADAKVVLDRPKDQGSP